LGDVKVRTHEGTAVLAIEGDLDAGACAALLAEARRLRGPAGAVVDLAAVPRVDAVGAGAICEAYRIALAAGVRLRLAGVSPEARRLLEVLRVPAVLREGVPPRFDPLAAPRLGLLELLGAGGIAVWRDARGLLSLAGETVYWAVAAPFRGRFPALEPIVRHIERFGTEGVPIVGLIGLLMGIALAINASYQLAPLGGLLWVANLVGVALARELGPVITAIVVAGRSGAEIAAEIGTMQVSEEIDALRTMGVNPVRFLVVPKVLGLCAALPLLTAYADLAGVLGGYAIGVGVYKISSDTYVSQTLWAVTNRDFLSGLLKSVAFAVLIGLTGCHRGFRVQGGAEGVGRAATSAVVTSILLIIVSDTIMTALFYYA
jgi:phospholipid/cholesterol/gamma-HCH transport system permease protein